MEAHPEKTFTPEEYKHAYGISFNAITNAIAILQKAPIMAPPIANALGILVYAQKCAEEVFCGSEERAACLTVISTHPRTPPET